MANTVLRLRQHHEIYAKHSGRPGPPKMLVFAHNSHIGDARQVHMLFTLARDMMG